MAISFSTTSGSATATVHDDEHGAALGDRVVFDSLSGLDGTTHDLLTGEFVIQTIPTVNTYTITLAANAGTTYSETGQAQAFYLLEKGIATSVAGPGWGSGTWGRLGWGSTLTNLYGQTLRVWSADNFGEDLIFNYTDGRIYYWDASKGLTSRAIELGNLGNAKEVPIIAKKVMVSEADRHVLALGCNPVGSTEQDPLLIRFSSQENPADWNPTATNTAGDIRLGQGSEIVAALKTSRQILVFTEHSLHTLQFIGPPFTFGESLIADNIRIIGPNAGISINDKVFWMGQNNFYMYDGRVQTIPCSVRKFVFDNLNRAQSFKVYAGAFSWNNEIWWFYPDESSSECNRYVVYNYLDNVWYFGTMNRTAWLEPGTAIRSYPYAATSDGNLYKHEVDGLFDDTSTTPSTPLNAFIESADFDIGDGDQFMLVRRVIPDILYEDSVSDSPTTTFSVKSKDFASGTATETVSGDVVRTISTPVEKHTDQLYLRARGRQMALRVESDELGTMWRLGAPRLDARPDGKR